MENELEMMLHYQVARYLRTHIVTGVINPVTIVFEQYLHDILADVVNVAPHGAQRNLSLGQYTQRVLTEFDRVKARLYRLGRGHELRKEEDALFNTIASLIERGDEYPVDGTKRIVLVEDPTTASLAATLRPSSSGRSPLGGIISWE